MSVGSGAQTLGPGTKAPGLGPADDGFLSAGVLLWVALLAALGGAALTALVLKGGLSALDRAAFDMVRSGAGFADGAMPTWLRESVRDITALGSTTVLTLAVAATTVFLAAARRGRLAVLMATSAAGATIFNFGLKALIGRSRPDAIEALVPTASASFPSGHALITMSVLMSIGGLTAFAAGRRSERVAVLGAALSLAVMVGLSRILLGVHWPSDVLAGWLFGLAWAGLTLHVARRMDRPGRDPDAAKGSAGASSPARSSSPSAPSASD